MPKVSVIMPVYNVENYLEQCLDCVINQTFKDIEIILVDDGSTDSSLKICKEYAQKDNRIKIIEQQNQGAGAARNKGLEIATGDYLSILDSDDYFEPDMLEKLYNKITSDDADIVICRCRSIDSVTGEIKPMPWTIKQNWLPSKQIFNYKDIPEYIFGFCVGWSWDKLYKREFVAKNNLKFQNLRSTNDMLFVFLSLVLAYKISVINDVLITHRYNRPNQLSETREKDPYCFITAIYALKEELEKLNLYPKLEKSFLNWCLLFCQWQTSTLSKATRKKVLKKLYQEVFNDLKVYDKPDNYFYEKYAWKQLIYPKKRFFKHFLKLLFSLTNQNTHKVLTILGISIKFKRNPLCFIKYIDKKQISNQIELCPYGLSEEKRTSKVIVSLTSFPQRMYDIHFCLYSLLNQSLKPDRLILWLAEEEFPNKEKDIPNTVLSFKEKGLEIKWCNNIKSYKKLIPALKEFPNAIIVTADDDIYYPVDWLEKLYNSYQKEPQYIHCHRAHKILFDSNKKILPYKMWEHETYNQQPDYINFFTGAGGVLYPQGCLNTDVLNEELFTSLAPNADDIWFWAMAVIQGTKIKVVEDNIKQLTYINPERELGLNGEATLCSQNCGKGQNDIQLAQVLKHYPQIMERIINE